MTGKGFGKGFGKKNSNRSKKPLCYMIAHEREGHDNFSRTQDYITKSKNEMAINENCSFHFLEAGKYDEEKLRVAFPGDKFCFYEDEDKLIDDVARIAKDMGISLEIDP